MLLQCRNSQNQQNNITVSHTRITWTIKSLNSQIKPVQRHTAMLVCYKYQRHDSHMNKEFKTTCT